MSSLSDTLYDQCRNAEILLDVLERESVAVIRGDIDALQQIGAEKEACCERIGNLQNSWPSPLLSAQARRWADTQGPEVAQAWASLMGCLRQCRRKNDANGLLIAERQNVIAQKLAPRPAPVYGAQGQAGTMTDSTWNASV